MSESAPGLSLANIFHPSDFSEASEVAFVHALKMALVARSRLTMMHVARGDFADWSEFPGVRETLVRWNLIAPDSPKSAVPALGIAVSKVLARQGEPVEAVLAHLQEHPAGLIVLATH